MTRRTWPLLLTAALISGAFSSTPARADQTEVPATVQIQDPVNDSNFLNDQGVWQAVLCNPSPCQGDHVTPADAGSVSDFIAGWFSHTATEISVHLQTQAAPPATTTLFFSVYTNPTDDPAVEPFGCLRMRARIKGAPTQGQDTSTYRGESFAEIVDLCTEGVQPADGKITIETGPENSGITTLTFPRIASPFLAAGATLKGPWAAARIAAGTDRTNWRTAAQSDNTKRGTDYVLTSTTPTKPPKKQPPGKSDPPGKKKGCKKGKGQKKGCPPRKSPPLGAACPTYTPYEAAKDAPITTVTDADTAEKPVEVPVETSAGLGAGRDPAGEGRLVSHAYLNVVVDPAAAETGLWAEVEFTETWDYDLYLDLSDGTQVAVAGGTGPLDDGNAGDSDSQLGSETITGVKSADCQGYTLDIVGATTPGEDVTVKLWLGEVVFEP